MDGKDAWLLFPAKLYCGQSLLDGRRESVIIDYAFTDDLPGYREMPDVLAGREGLEIRDEIRMVRPGFYLGRAYIKKVFALNFTLYNKAVAEKEAPSICQFWSYQRGLLGRQSTHDGHGQQDGHPTCPVNGNPVKRGEPINRATDGKAVGDETGMSDHDDGIGFRM